MVRAAIYARTSGPESESVEDQVGICRRRCEERDWSVRYILRDEGESGGNPLRPGYQALCDHVIEARIDVLVVWKIDRMARSLAEMTRLEEALRENGVSLHSCTEPIDTTTAQGRFVFGILATAGQLERELGSERIRTILAERARRGMWLHATAPFGYALGKGRILRQSPVEAPVVRQVFNSHRRQGSFAEVAAELNARQVYRRKRPWTAGTIQRIVENRIYCGTYEHWHQVVNRENLAIVTPEVWCESLAIRQKNPRRGKSASQRVRLSSIKSVFDQYVAGLAYLDEERPGPVSGTFTRIVANRPNQILRPRN